MPCVCYGDDDIQNAFWEGFTQQHEVTNLLVWNFFGEIIFAALNFPGSWHDSKLGAASGLYRPMLTKHTPPGLALLGDSAFPRSVPELRGKLVRARKANEGWMRDSSDVPRTAWMAAIDTLLERAMPSERQSAEWGVRAIKGPFGRLKVALPADARARYRILACCAHLYNFRTRFVGLNQIRTVYTRNVGGPKNWVQELRNRN